MSNTITKEQAVSYLKACGLKNPEAMPDSRINLRLKQARVKFKDTAFEDPIAQEVQAILAEGPAIVEGSEKTKASTPVKESTEDKSETPKKKAAKKTAKKKTPAKKKAAAKPKKEKLPPEEKKNGYRRPRPGTKVREVWDICDSLMKDGVPPTRKQVLDACMEKGHTSISSTATEYSRWKIYSGFRNYKFPGQERKKAAKKTAKKAPAKKAVKKTAKKKVTSKSKSAKKAPRKAAPKKRVAKK